MIPNNPSYDIIGDIHGYADHLEQLLKKLGYSKHHNGYYHHPERTALFVGDYIDRGEKSKEVIDIVRSMQLNNAAIALMGNHEYNALCFHTRGQDGEYLREHTVKNISQHCMTMSSFKDDIYLKDALEWIQTLPLFIETDSFRAVHACWDAHHIDFLKQSQSGNQLAKGDLELSAKNETPLYEAIECILKGRELKLPDDISFKDKDEHPRHEIRLKWWEEAKGKSYVDMAVKVEKEFVNLTTMIPDSLLGNKPIYGVDEKPVFFGHYWLESPAPDLQRSNVCCLDYSVAKKGNLVAYRYDGESVLDPGKFRYV
jgi:hypothetical protein